MSEGPVLRVGCSSRLKYILILPLLISMLCMWALNSWGATLNFGGFPFLFMIVSLGAAVFVVCTHHELDAEGITKSHPLGKRRFSKDQFLDHELIDGIPGRGASLLLRFRDGTLQLEQSETDTKLGEIVEFIENEWTGRQAGPRRRFLVDAGTQTFIYGGASPALSALMGIFFLLMALRVPTLWVGVLLAGFCFRIAWRAGCRIETTEQGISSRNWLGVQVTIPWQEVVSVEYWTSVCQGGVCVIGAGQKVLAYRWINEYPKLDFMIRRSVPDRVVSLDTLPAKISLNRRDAILNPVAVMLLGALPVFWIGDWRYGVILAGVPLMIGSIALLSFDRSLEIDREQVRDRTRFFWDRQEVCFKREDLEDAKIERHPTAGGLWLRFRNGRVQIPNSSAVEAPERILASLQRHWLID